MFKKTSIDQYFETIKDSYNRYLQSKMVTHFAIVGIENKKAIIDIYLDYIKNYRELEKNSLDDAVRDPTANEILSRGALSLLLGMGAGAAVFTGEQKLPSTDMFGAKTATQGGFAAVIGASCSSLIYQAWSKSQEKPANADANSCKEEMKKAGFTESKFAELSLELVKLFYFRECLLDKSKGAMRTGFKVRYFTESNTQLFDNKDFNLALEVYFLQQLNELFYQAFNDIYQIQTQKIQNKEHEFGFIKWFRTHFETEKNRKKFTQQLQIGFMNECVRFLEKELHQPGKIGQFAVAFDSIIGLFVGAAAAAILVVINPFTSIFGLACIGVVFFLLAASITHLVITQTDVLYYKRDKHNREAIQSAIDAIQKEQNRLSIFLQNTVETIQQDLVDLKTYDEENHSSFLKIFHWKGAKKHNIALGSVRGWVREFIHRFRESEFIGVDLSDRVKQIMHDSHDQSEQLQVALLKLISSPKDPSSLKKWDEMIEDTQAYLIDPEHARFIKAFHLVEKIREQFLEIVGHISPTQRSQPLPTNIVRFYTNPLNKGGLGGLLTELNQARAMAWALPDNLALKDHPYHRFLNTALCINLKFNESSKNKFILQGDETYRKILGFPTAHCTRIEEQLNVGNIQIYLSTSFDFLYSLNIYKSTHPNFNQAFQNNEQFILYRMLFVKQLADLANPINVRVDSMVKKEIQRFVKKRFKSNPEIALSDILSQSFLMTTPGDKKVIDDQLGHPHAISDLSYIADAIRVDIIYMSTPVAPSDLLAFAAEQYLKADNTQIILGYHSSSKLIAEFSARFYNDMHRALLDTKGFIETIKKQPLLKQTGTTNSYINIVLAEVAHIVQQINILEKQKISEKNNPSMQKLIQELDDFKNLLCKKSINPTLKNAKSERIKKITGESNKPEIAYLEEKNQTIEEGTETLVYSKQGNQFNHQQIEKLKQYQQTEEAAALADEKPSLGFFRPQISRNEIGRWHAHSRQSKIESALALKKALEQLDQEQTITEAYDWDNDVFTTNKHLKTIVDAILKQYKKESLSALFSESSLSYHI